MKILNLVYKDQSEIEYDIINYPDGQTDIIIKNWTQWYKDDNIVQIKTRLNNFEDLGLLACAKAALQRLDIKVVHLYAPYILGARSDRQFVEGGTSYLVDIIAPFINRLNFESVTCLDPHSFVLEGCVNNFRKISNSELVDYSLYELYKDSMGNMFDKFILISPDAGASKKIYKLAEQIGYKGDIITCSKNRDKNGKLTKCIVPMGKYWNDTKDVIIIDDIADGAGTFINIAKEMKANGYKSKLYLIVTHGIFSKGFQELSKYFDGIYCTNSYKDIDLSQATLVKNNKTLLKQLNVF